MTISIKPVVEGEDVPQELSPDDALADMKSGALVGFDVYWIQDTKVSVNYPEFDLKIDYTGPAGEMAAIVAFARQIEQEARQAASTDSEGR